MNKQIKKYRIKRVSLSRFVLQEWSIWFPIWMQVDLSRYQLMDEISEISASKINVSIIDSHPKMTKRHHWIVNFILAVILLFITG